jgi:formylglycine-generating enzyme required for sulfatase activity
MNKIPIVIIIVFSLPVFAQVNSGKDTFIEMIQIPPKTFPLFDKNIENRPPQMFQTVDSYLIGKYEITQSQFESVMGYNNSACVGPNKPKDKASWYEAIVFCNLLSLREGLNPVYILNNSTDPKDWGPLPADNGKGQWDANSGDFKKWDKVICIWENNGYRLPTEMEWRSAAMGKYNGPTFGRAGVIYKFAGDPYPGSVENKEDLFGWYRANSENDGSHDVGQKSPNDYGVFDMAGNVWEWVWDWASGKGYYLNDEVNYRGPTTGNGDKIRAGGSWHYESYFAANSGHKPYYQELDAGFRVARTSF